MAGYLPPLLALAVAVAGGAVAGGAYAFVPGFLKARTGAHEVITTLMLNGIAPNLAFLIVAATGLPGRRPAVPPVPTLVDLPMVRVDYGLVVALAMAAVVSWLLFRTSLGFELRATGWSRTAARAAGIRPGRTTMLAMALSGGLVGMGSALFGLGPAWGVSGSPANDMGYLAIGLALLGGRRPSGVVLAALLYGALTNGAESMVVVTGTPLALLTVIAALAIMFVAAPDLTRSIWRLGPTPSPAAPGSAAGTDMPASPVAATPGAATRSADRDSP